MNRTDAAAGQVAELLRFRHTLRAGEDAPAPPSIAQLDESLLASAGLFPLPTLDDPPRFALLPSLVLPPTCPQLCFSRLSPVSAADMPDFNLRLDPERHWNELLASRRARSWWMGGHPERLPRLKDRLAKLVALESGVRAVLADRVGIGNEDYLRSVFVTGSFLWAEVPGPKVDVIALVDDRFPEGIVHWQNASTHDRSLPAIDILVVAMRFLTEVDPPDGTIGEWRVPENRVLPYDLSYGTILAAIRQTLAAGIPVYGPDPFDRVEQSDADLLALSRYFLQEASILLDERIDIAKAAQRIHEAVLILLFIERRAPCGEEDALVDLLGDAAYAVGRLRAEPDDDELIADVQGWWGREQPALLERAARALARSWNRFCGPRADGSDRSLAALVRRARRKREPAWVRLAARLDRLGYAGRVVELTSALLEGAHSTLDRPGYAAYEPIDEPLLSRDDSDEALERLLLPPATGPRESDPVSEAIRLERMVELEALTRVLTIGIPLTWWFGDLVSLEPAP